MKKLFISVPLILVGVAILCFPSLVNYIDTSSMYFNFSKFLNDNPGFTYPVGILCIIGGILYTYFIILNNRANTAFVIQKSDEDDYGNIDLHFPKLSIWNRDEIVYENFVTLKNHSKSIIEIEKKKIKNFYSRIGGKEKIAFLAVSPIPTLVYAGFTVANCGRKVVYFHFDRDNTRSTKLKCYGQGEKLKEVKTIKSSSQDYVLCFSTSYPIDQKVVINQFSNYNIKFFNLPNPHYNAVKTLPHLIYIADFVRKEISNLPAGSKVHLLLSCSSELCFAIGQRLNSPALPNIKVYNLGKRNNNNSVWDWSIDLN